MRVRRRGRSVATSKNSLGQNLPYGMMPFFQFGEPGSADWLVRQPPAGSDAVGWHVPSGFPAYVRIRYPARQVVPTDRTDRDDKRPPNPTLITQEAYMRALARGRTDVYAPIEHHFLMDQPELAAAVLDILSPRTARSPNRMLQCAFWEGGSCNGCDAPLFRTAQERFHLFEAPESSVLRWLVDQGDRRSPRWSAALAGQEPPCLIWPADRHWCLALPYSYGFAVAACPPPLAQRILDVPGLDASPTAVDDPLDAL